MLLSVCVCVFFFYFQSALKPTLFSELKASWPLVKEKEVNCSGQAAIWVPEAIREGCS